MFAKLLNLILGWLSGRSAAERSGATEAANVSLQAGVETIKRANEAAKAVEHTSGAIDEDPDNLDRK